MTFGQEKLLAGSSYESQYRDLMDYKINLRHLFSGKDTSGGKGSISVKYSLIILVYYFDH